MKIEIEFSTSGASFENEMYWDEITMVLGQAASKVYTQLTRMNVGVICDAPETADKVIDSNGNTIGLIKVQL